MLQAFLDGTVFGSSTGDGPTAVLLLHGWRRTHADFDEAAASLAHEGVSSVAVDLPGFGATPPPALATGARGYAARLAPLVQAIADASGPPVLVGHSLGGRVAVCLAAAMPDAVGGLVLAGVPLVRSAMPASTPSRRYQALRTGARLGLVSAARLEAARRRYGSADYRAATGVMRDVLVAMVSESYEAELSAIRCPVALVWGSNDATVPLGVAEAATTLLDDARLDVLDGVGHLVPTEAPAGIVAATVSMRRGAR